ncbi:MAG TPA: ThiF family adenylyltransferase [Dehalococcoidia bacterium]|nr:ThiF family adenylyltransferase [Dehalococcoidia bacterium]
MFDIAAQDQALRRLAETGILIEAHPLSPTELYPFAERGVVCALEGKVIVAEQGVVLCVGVDRRFPLSLPKVFLRPPDALGFIPHVDGNGYVCYADAEGLLLNSEDPVGILREATTRAVGILEDGASSKNRWEFMDEFLSYWRRLQPRQRLLAFLRVDDVLRRVRAYTSRGRYAWVADGDRAVLAYFNGNPKALTSLTQRTALYIPLREGSFITPPSPGHLWSAAEISAIVQEALSADNLRRLTWLGRKWKAEELVILGVPRPSGGRTLVGLRFRGVTGGHPLLEGDVQEMPEPIEIQRLDPGYLVARGGGQVELGQFRVLLVGCGSVGSYVALALPQAGPLNLTMVDPDIMRPENTFRHALGYSVLGAPKVTALKAELERKYPYIAVTAHQKYIEEAMMDGLLQVSTFDLVIVALGNPTVELYLNRVLHERPAGPKAVFAWLEPYGIGGHVLLTRPGMPGCLQCLYTPASDLETPLRNRAAFAAYGQSFGKDDLGCGSQYTPYGALDAQRTAEHAVRLALDGLTGREPGSPLLSWKGPDDAFKAAGFQVAPRYLLTADQLYERRYGYIDPLCRVCRESKG